jgi:hypothetical protein
MPAAAFTRFPHFLIMRRRRPESESRDLVNRFVVEGSRKMLLEDPQTLELPNKIALTKGCSLFWLAYGGNK